MTTKFNPNLLSPNDRGWLEEIDKNFDEYITTWIGEQKRGALTIEDIIMVATKIAELRKDNSLVEKIKKRMGLL
ncbi:MAG: hypothetical protein A2534_00955 [Candidatus Magasanikbacteria bacterium RIFOXYD2_FULL_39_9]|uniref:Uncharacterized protein n=1 Tax=Candidatus Magasanikbacteria bacterium RIFOXYD1_FULL_40_23 TaxID=1798705 RepID=A0A1F6P8M5_9BACT|nr:MAG: hypothetical protein A2563_02480 [Candidatus Magasanikbacteria bacterium RIFOXYD1_FULL_40_23]OGH93156.1 MAG: hypothetical protein A2534_00955 [Candidatus Magasanikbacteria bacterium RIFOXYD2_FULL_39_9]